jgi:hypothetical protein
MGAWSARTIKEQRVDVAPLPERSNRRNKQYVEPTDTEGGVARLGVTAAGKKGIPADR